MTNEHEDKLVDDLREALKERLAREAASDAFAPEWCSEVCGNNGCPDLLEKVLLSLMLDAWIELQDAGKDVAAQALCERFRCPFLTDKLAAEIAEQIAVHEACSHVGSDTPSEDGNEPERDSPTNSEHRFLPGHILAGDDCGLDHKAPRIVYRFRLDELIAEDDCTEVWKGFDLATPYYPHCDQVAVVVPKRQRRISQEALVDAALNFRRNEHLNIMMYDLLTGLTQRFGFVYISGTDFDFVVWGLKAPMRLLDNSYELIERFGDGGHTVVWRGIDRQTEGRVAIKMPRLESVESFDQFLREARTVANLELHPNIVPIYKFGSVGDSCYLVFPFMEGGSLFALIDRGPVSSANAARIVAQVAEDSAYAHKYGRLHRDIHPGNILFDRLGTAKLSDFGISTSTGKRGGSRRCNPAYMSPEEADGRDVDERSDLYSLGVCLYVMLTSKLPYPDTDDPETMRQQIIVGNLTVECPPIVPKELQRICQKLLAKEPENRYQSAAQVAAELWAVENGESQAGRSFATAFGISYEEAVMLKRGKQAFDDKGYEWAEKEFSECIRLDPCDADAYKQRGVCRLKRAKVEESLADFSMAIRLDPTDPEFYKLRAMAYRSLGQLDQAIADVETALELEPTDPGPYHRLREQLYMDSATIAADKGESPQGT